MTRTIYNQPRAVVQATVFQDGSILLSQSGLDYSRPFSSWAEASRTIAQLYRATVLKVKRAEEPR